MEIPSIRLICPSAATPRMRMGTTTEKIPSRKIMWVVTLSGLTIAESPVMKAILQAIDPKITPRLRVVKPLRPELKATKISGSETAIETRMSPKEILVVCNFLARGTRESVKKSEPLEMIAIERTRRMMVVTIKSAYHFFAILFLTSEATNVKNDRKTTKTKSSGRDGVILNISARADV